MVKIFFTLLCLFHPITCLADYAMPVGIPSPGLWGTTDPINSATPADPASWPGSATAGYYYVDNSVTCTDTSNTYGYPNNPRCTPVTTLAAGAVQVINNGTYTASLYTWAISGTAESPVWIVGKNATKFTNQFRLRVASYAIFDNIDFDRSGEVNNTIWDIRPGANGELVSNICIRNSDMLGEDSATGNTSMVNINGSYYDTPIENIIVFHNTIHGAGIYSQDGGETVYNVESNNDIHAVASGAGITGLWILGNTIHTMGGDGIGNSHDANHTAHDIYIGGNTIYNCRENAIDIKEADGIIISGNDLYGTRPVSSSSNGALVVLHYGPTTGEGPFNMWILNNRMHDAPVAMQINGLAVGGNTHIFSNLFYNLEQDTVSPASGAGGVGIYSYDLEGYLYIENNTFYNYRIAIDHSDFSGTGNVVRNNIFSTRNDANGYEYWAGVSDYTKLASDYNLFDSALDGGVKINWNGTIRNLVDTQSINSRETHSISGSPAFVSAPTNLRLIESSSAINIGTTPSSFADHLAKWEVPASTDISGTSRPQSGSWDIGAYEYPGRTKASIASSGTIFSSRSTGTPISILE